MTKKQTPAALLMARVVAARRRNLRALIGPGLRFETSVQMSKEVGVTKSYLHQLFGPKPIRKVSEATARKLEMLLKLPLGSLDVR